MRMRDQSPQNAALLMNKIQKWWSALTHMAGNVHAAVGEANTVPAHFVDQILPKNNDFLGAVLNPEWKLIKVNYKVDLPLIQTIE